MFPLRITKKHFNSLKDLATKTHDIKNITRRDVLRQNGRPYTAWVPKLGFGKKKKISQSFKTLEFKGKNILH